MKHSRSGLCNIVFAVLFFAGFTPAVVNAGEEGAGNDLPPEASEQSGGQAADLWSDYEETDQPQKLIWDPLEPWNRAMFHVNDKLYFWAIKPVAQGYSSLVPQPGRSAVQNFFQNLTTPVRLANCLLQTKWQGAGAEVGRFALNTTVGCAGFFDFAKRYDCLAEPYREDLGQTLGHYGWRNGLFILWPLIGASSVRDTLGFVGDRFLDPVRYVNPWELSTGLTATDRINATSLRLGDYESFKESALEPYVALRDAYVQNRRARVKD